MTLSMPMTLCFRDRSWSEGMLPLFDENPAIDDLDEYLVTKGYNRVETLGSEDAIYVEIWEHPDEGWLAIYNTNESWHPIKIERLQDLIDFMAHIAPSVIASVIPSDAVMILHDLCDRSEWRKEMRRLEKQRKREERTASEEPQDDGEERTS
jgi:hypothetical protein